MSRHSLYFLSCYLYNQIFTIIYRRVILSVTTITDQTQTKRYCCYQRPRPTHTYTIARIYVVFCYITIFFFKVLGFPTQQLESYRHEN